MKSENNFKNGFTLIELIVAIAISGLILVAMSSLMFALFSSNKRVTQLDTLEQAKNDLQGELSNSVRWAKAITFTTDELNVDNGITNNIFRFQGGKLYKNGISLVSNDVKVTSFDIKNLSTDLAYKSLVISIDLEHAKFNAVKDSLRVVASQRYGSQ